MTNIYCNRNDLNIALSNLSHSIPRRTTSPMLSCALIRINNGEMYLSTTDMNIMIETVINVECSEELEIAIPYSIFQRTVSKLPEEDIMMIFDKDENKLTIKSGKYSSQHVCISSEEYPRVMIKESEDYIKFDKNIFKKMIQKTSFSANSDEINGILTGVLIKNENKKISMVACDTFRVALNENKTDIEKNFEVVVPAKLLQETSRIIGDGEENNEIKIDVIDNKIVMIFDNNKVVINTLNGKFIDYERIINISGPLKIRVKNEDLINSIDRASIFSSFVENNFIKISINEDVLKINSLSEEGNMEESIDIIKEGPDLEIGFNSQYLKEVLKAIDDEEILLSMKTSTDPCIITPLKEEKYLYLILPVRIK